MSEDTERMRAYLSALLQQGFPNLQFPIETVDFHRSSGQDLPILTASPPANTEIIRYSENYAFHFLSVRLRQPIPATLLYPISKAFVESRAGHVNYKFAPPILDFERRYHTQQKIERFGGKCSYGFSVVATLRYLEAVARLDFKKILAVCYKETEEGWSHCVNGEYVDLAKLMTLLGCTEHPKSKYAQFTIDPLNSRALADVTINKFLTPERGSSVRVTLKDPFILPILTAPVEHRVSISDTLFLTQLPVHLRPIVQEAFSCVPPCALSNSHANTNPDAAKLERFRDKHYPCDTIYHRINMHTRTFTLKVPNVLDAALLAFHFVKVLGPLMEEALPVAP